MVVKSIGRGSATRAGIISVGILAGLVPVRPVTLFLVRLEARTVLGEKCGVVVIHIVCGCTNGDHNVESMAKQT